MSSLLEISEEYVPGTVHLLDNEGITEVSKRTENETSIVLHPQPSKDPNDPLRWSKTKKAFNFTILVFSSFAMGCSIVWSGPIWDIWISEFDCTYTELNISTAICFIFLAFGCFALQPIASYFGKRVVYLICSILQIVGAIVYMTATTYQSIWAACAIVGFGSSPIYAIVVLSTTDIFFQHERTFKVSVIVFTIFGATALSPLVAAYVTSGIGWRWCPRIFLIWFGVLFIIQLFFMEGTDFRRTESNEALEKEIVEQIRSYTTIEQQNHDLKIKGSEKEIHVIPLDDISSTVEIDTSIPLKTRTQRLKLIETEHAPRGSIISNIIWPLRMYLLVIIGWCGCLQGLQQMWLSFVVNTQVLFFASPPYNFNTGDVGLTNLSTLVGILLGTYYGHIVDKVSIWFARKNNGIFEPEFRLWTLIPPFIANAGGLLMYALGPYYGAQWMVAMVGSALIGFSMTTVTSIAFTYCCDCYPELEGSSLVSVGILNNVVPIPFSFCVATWIDNNGVKFVTCIIFFISMVFNLTFVGFLVYGKSIRRASIKQFKIFLASEDAY